MTEKTRRFALAALLIVFVASVTATGCNSFKECKKESIPVETVDN